MSNCLKAVRKSVVTSINKTAPSQSIEQPALEVKKCSNIVDIKQIPVVDPNTYVDISDLKIDFNLLDFKG